MTHWLPIESAPRGHILVYGKPQNLVVDGKTLTNYHSAFVHSAHWDEIDGCFVVDGGSWLGPFVEPTHWMPLPDPPVDTLESWTNAPPYPPVKG